MLSRHTVWLSLIMAAVVIVSSFGCGGRNSSSTSRSTTSEPRGVVFIGSSSTARWDLAVSFPGKNYVNLGKSGDESSDMLARFQGVIDRKPFIVHIWAGDNDDLSSTQVQSNIQAMVLKAKQAGIRPVLATLTPKRGDEAINNDFIVSFNSWLKQYGTDNGIPVVDYYPLVVAADGTLSADLAVDEQHLNATGYQVITVAAAAAIATASK